MHVIITCKYLKGRIKNSQEKVATLFFSILTLLWPNFKLIQALMYVIVTCKYEMDPIKNSQKKWQHHFSNYKSMGIFSDAQRQLTPQSVVESGPIRNSSELLCMSSLPASMKKVG